MSDRWKWVSWIFGTIVVIVYSIIVIENKKRMKAITDKYRGQVSNSSTNAESPKSMSPTNRASSAKSKNSLSSSRQVASGKPSHSSKKGESDGDPWNSLERRLKEWDPKAPWKVRRENESLVRAISGGVIPAKGADIQSVQSFLEELGDSLGVSTKELSPPTRRTFDVENIYEAKQVIQGYEVDGAFVKVFSRRSDGAIYYLASEMKVVNHPLLRKDLDLAAARNVVAPRFAGKSFEIEGSDSVQGANPRIYVKDEKYSELVWVFIVKVTAPTYDRRMIYVGAQSGQVLLDESLLMH